MSANKYCPDPDSCTYSDCPTAFCDRNAQHSLAAMQGSAAACLTCIHWNRFEWQTPHGYGKCCVHQINTRASYECADYQKPKPPNVRMSHAGLKP